MALWLQFHPFVHEWTVTPVTESVSVTCTTLLCCAMFVYFYSVSPDLRCYNTSLLHLCHFLFDSLKLKLCNTHICIHLCFQYYAGLFTIIQQMQELLCSSSPMLYPFLKVSKEDNIIIIQLFIFISSCYWNCVYIRFTRKNNALNCLQITHTNFWDCIIVQLWESRIILCNCT